MAARPMWSTVTATWSGSKNAVLKELRQPLIFSCSVRIVAASVVSGNLAGRPALEKESVS